MGLDDMLPIECSQPKCQSFKRTTRPENCDELEIKTLSTGVNNIVPKDGTSNSGMIA